MNFELPYPERIRTINLKNENLITKRQEILNYFEQTFSLYENLFTLLKNEDAFYQKADPLRHPLIFYLGHTAVFYINKLVLANLIKQRINTSFESQFAIGVDEMSWDDINSDHYDWPSPSELFAYRQNVRSAVINVIQSMEITLPIQWKDPTWIILMGIEHERIHLETSSVLIRQLPLNLVKTDPQWPACQITHNSPENSLIAVSGKKIFLGKDNEDDLYGWDNEYGYNEIDVNDFKASRYLVSNKEFLSFMQDGGYLQSNHWTEEGWKWREYLQVQHPRFWRKDNENNYYLRLLAEEIPMPWDWPVEVNYLEAKAFCNWLKHKTQKPIRLPTEAEWYILRQSIKEAYPNWKKASGNIDLCYYASPCPVNQFQHGEFFDIIGNVWQWTETPFNSFDGFKVHPAYDDFSIPTFNGQHNLIKGGSWISTGNEATYHARYAFRRHFYQHAGFRYVESVSESQQKNSSYECDTVLAQYLEFHFGSRYFGVENFPKKIVELALQAIPTPSLRCKALDLGCAVGRASFELAKHFDQVVGIDFSARFIHAATLLQTQGYINYHITTEGDLKEDCHFDLNTLGLKEKQKQNIQFWQGDACNLKSQFKDFNLIIAANLIDRLYDPQEFLRKIHQYLAPEGILLISSPYTWIEEYTEKSKWLGGIKQNNKEKTTYQTLHELLKPHFVPLQDPQNIEFVIRETRRKFQHSLSEVTLWKRC